MNDMSTDRMTCRSKCNVTRSHDVHDVKNSINFFVSYICSVIGQATCCDRVCRATHTPNNSRRYLAHFAG